MTLFNIPMSQSSPSHPELQVHLPGATQEAQLPILLSHKAIYYNI